MARQRHLLLAVVGLLAVTMGASCPQMVGRYPVVGPRVLPETSTLDDVTRAVNNNSSLVHSVMTDDASISVPGAPTIRARLAVEQPGRFRLRGETAFTGPELDLGSNDELFWFWVRRNTPPALFYCRHADFAQSNARQLIPVEPQWLVEALGLTYFDSRFQHQGPVPISNGRLEIRTQLPGAQGPLTKITVVDSARAWVLEQHLYDQYGKRLATSLTSRQWRDPATGAVLPQKVEIQWPATNFSMELNLRDLRVNQTAANPQELWTLPKYDGYPLVNLADPNLQFTPPPTAAQNPANTEGGYAAPGAQPPPPHRTSLLNKLRNR